MEKDNERHKKKKCERIGPRRRGRERRREEGGEVEGLVLNRVVRFPFFLFFPSYLFSFHTIHLYLCVPSIHCSQIASALTFPLSQLQCSSTSLQKIAGLLGILMEHGITRCNKTSHKQPNLHIKIG